MNKTQLLHSKLFSFGRTVLTKKVVVQVPKPISTFSWVVVLRIVVSEKQRPTTEQVWHCYSVWNLSTLLVWADCWVYKVCVLGHSITSGQHQVHVWLHLRIEDVLRFNPQITSGGGLGRHIWPLSFSRVYANVSWATLRDRLNNWRPLCKRSIRKTLCPLCRTISKTIKICYKCVEQLGRFNLPGTCFC